MTIAGKQVSILVLLSILLASLVTGGSTLTLFVDTFGNQRWISIIGLVAGQIQFIITAYVHETTSSSGPVAHA
jgi:hypothetical protein